MDESNVSVEDQAAAAEEFVSGLVAAIGFEGDVTSSVDDDIIEVHVEGSELGLLVGPGRHPHGNRKSTRAVVHTRGRRPFGARPGRCRRLPRRKRREALAEFTKSIVAEVLETGESRALEPMGSLDRKTVHDTVNEIDRGRHGVRR